MTRQKLEEKAKKVRKASKCTDLGVVEFVINVNDLLLIHDKLNAAASHTDTGSVNQRRAFEYMTEVVKLYERTEPKQPPPQLNPVVENSVLMRREALNKYATVALEKRRASGDPSEGPVSNLEIFKVQALDEFNRKDACHCHKTLRVGQKIQKFKNDFGHGWISLRFVLIANV